MTAKAAPRTRKTTSTTRTKPAKQETKADQKAELILAAILKCLDDNKAEDVVHIPMAGKSAIADYMVIASGRSSRHVTALSEHIDTELAKLDHKTKLEGRENGDWVLVDANDVIVHLFRPEVRSFYNLEKLWDIAIPAAPAL